MTLWWTCVRCHLERVAHTFTPDSNEDSPRGREQVSGAPCSEQVNTWGQNQGTGLDSTRVGRYKAGSAFWTNLPASFLTM
jgi:hypothetical protein